MVELGSKLRTFVCLAMDARIYEAGELIQHGDHPELLLRAA